MKKLIIVIALLAVPSVAIAAGVMKRDSNKVTFPSIAPTVIGTKLTGASAAGFQTGSITTTTYSRIRVQPNAAATVKINGTGIGYPIAQNATLEMAIPSGVTSLLFTNASSATGTTVYYQAEE